MLGKYRMFILSITTLNNTILVSNNNETTVIEMNVVTDSKNNNSINIIQIADITRPRGDTMFVFER